MASTATTSAPFDQFAKFGDQLAEIGTKAGKLYLDGYEKAVGDVADFERKLAEQSKIDGVQIFLNAQADLITDVTKATTAATRKVLA